MRVYENFSFAVLNFRVKTPPIRVNLELWTIFQIICFCCYSAPWSCSVTESSRRRDVPLPLLLFSWSNSSLHSSWNWGNRGWPLQRRRWWIPTPGRTPSWTRGTPSEWLPQWTWWGTRRGCMSGGPLKRKVGKCHCLYENSQVTSFRHTITILQSA